MVLVLNMMAMEMFPYTIVAEVFSIVEVQQHLKIYTHVGGVSELAFFSPKPEAMCDNLCCSSDGDYSTTVFGCQILYYCFLGLDC